MNYERSSNLRSRAHAIIPGGCHTYAKGDDQYPELAPGFIVRGKGCHVWDADDNEFIEYGMGLRAVSLGHAHEPIIAAAYRQMLLGHNFVRPSSLEVECAEKFLELISGAEMVKFGKNGSDATNAAVKLSRAYTGRDMIAICGDHPFYSVDDWFIGTTPISAGIPDVIKRMTVKFRYNDIGSVQELFDQYPNQIACLILEPEKDIPPVDNFLHRLQELCKKMGAVLIFDETITGFRWHNGGGQAFHGVVPDLSTFGKAMGNGFSISALAGKKDIMKLGGLDHDRERVFLLSLTHGAELPNLAASLEVMKIYQNEPVVDTLWQRGKQLSERIEQLIASHGLEGYFALIGRPCCLVYATRDQSRQSSQAFRALFLQETIRRGILAPSLIVSYSHLESDINATVDAIDGALAVYRKALTDGVDKFLTGRPVKPAFRTFN